VYKHLLNHSLQLQFFLADPTIKEPFGCANKLAEKHCWLICYERKILFWLKKQTKKDGL
jgi:hypothetical protein